MASIGAIFISTYKLQAQELELSSQIKTTSKAQVTHTDRAKSQNVSRKSNVVVYGIEECPPKTPKSARLQSDSNAVSKICSSMDVHIEPNQVVDCFRLGKFKSNQSWIDLTKFAQPKTIHYLVDQTKAYSS